jgi:glutathione S-transferase
MTNPILWIAPGACSLAPHILIREAGIDFETILINVKPGFPEEYRHMNPKGRVPILQIGDITITEVPAIMTAISQMVPGKHLLGKTNLEIVRTYEWCNWLSGTVHAQAFGGVRRTYRFSDDPETYESIRAKGRKTVEESFEYIEERLQGTHAVGDSFTAVDGFLLVFYRWGNQLEFDMRAKYPKFTSLVEEGLERDSVKAAFREEGIEFWV